MIQTPPFENDIPGLDVNFLKSSVHYPTHTARQAIFAQVILSRLIRREQRRAPPVYEPELVHVRRRRRAASLDGLHNLVLVVHDYPVTSRKALVLVSPEEAEVVFALVFTHVHMMGGNWAEHAGAGPDEVAIIIVYIRPAVEVVVWS